jgi:hypothetical protein
MVKLTWCNVEICTNAQLAPGCTQPKFGFIALPGERVATGWPLLDRLESSLTLVYWKDGGIIEPQMAQMIDVAVMKKEEGLQAQVMLPADPPVTGEMDSALASSKLQEGRLAELHDVVLLDGRLLLGSLLIVGPRSNSCWCEVARKRTVNTDNFLVTVALFTHN